MRKFQPIEAVVPGLVLAALALSTAAAFAADWELCGGEPVKWRKQLDIQRNRCSIPDTGDRNAAYWNGVNQWDDLTDEVDGFLVRPADDCTITDGDGMNEIAVVARASIDGANGQSTMVTGQCFGFPFTNDIDQGDIKIASTLSNGNTMPFFNPPQDTAATDGRTVFVHEFGHFFGFEHRELFVSAMQDGFIPKTGGSQTATVFPDDTLGINALYGLNFFAPQLLPSAHFISGVTTTLLESGTRDVCRGEAQTIRFYMGNAGNTNTGTYGLRIRLTTTASSVGTVAQTYTHSFNQFSELINTFAFTVPNVPNGVYFIYLDMDWFAAVPHEPKETDNTTRSGRRLNVRC